MLVTIVGGAGAMGRWFARFFKHTGHEVRIVDRSERTPEIARSLGVDFIKEDVLALRSASTSASASASVASAKNKISEITDTDVLLVSVPIEITCEVIETLGVEMKKGSLLMDLTSVKRKPVEKMRECTAEGVEILGTHPLFGPTARSMRNQTVIIVEVPERKGRLCSHIEEIFKREGAKIEFMSAEEHDRTMAVIQGLTHFVLLSYGITLRRLKFNQEISRRYMSPMYEIFMDFVGRILHQDPQLYASIQMNFDMKEIHDAFISTASKLASLISRREREEFEREISEARRHFGNTEKALNDSDEIIEEKLRRRACEGEC